MRLGRRESKGGQRATLAVPASVSRNLSGESLIPRRGTWGARPGQTGTDCRTGQDGLEDGRHDDSHGVAQGHGEAQRHGEALSHLEAQGHGEAQRDGDWLEPDQAPVQRVRWNLSA